MPVDAKAPDGTLEPLDDGRQRLAFERRLAHPPERVWAAITEPDLIEAWLAAAEVDLVEGGRVQLRWLNEDPDKPGEEAVARGTVSRLEPPRLLELETDIHGVLRWELEPEGDGCRLRFTATLELPHEYRTKNLAGWHVHHDFLDEFLKDGTRVNWSGWPLDRWAAHHERYVARYG